MQRIWKGDYNYIDENGSPIDFCSFEIRAEISANSFEGTVYEQAFTEASGEQALVKGFFQNDIISFVLTYPFSWDYNAEGKILLHRDQRGHSVTYFGRLNPETLNWEGTWEIEFDQEMDSIDPELIHFSILSGDWKMKMID